MKKDLLLYFALLLWFVVPLQAQPTIFSPDIVVEEEEIIEVEIKAKNLGAIVAAQFSVGWDDNVLEFMGFQDWSLSTNNMNHNVSTTGKLRIQWYSDVGEAVEDNAVLGRLQFKVIGEPNAMSLIEIGDDSNEGGTSFVVEFISSDYQIYNMTLEDGSVTVNGPINTSTDVLADQKIALHQNFPNPFSETTAIKFDLLQSEDIQIQVIDMIGKTIYQHTKRYEQGTHMFHISDSDLPVTGVYFYRIASDTFDLTKKMVFNKN